MARRLLAAVVVLAAVAIGCQASQPQSSLASFDAFAVLLEGPDGERRLTGVPAIEREAGFPIAVPAPGAAPGDAAVTIVLVRPPAVATAPVLLVEFRTAGGTLSLLQSDASATRRDLLVAAEIFGDVRDPRATSVNDASAVAGLLSRVRQPPRGASADGSLRALEWMTCDRLLILVAEPASGFSLDELRGMAASVPADCA